MEIDNNQGKGCAIYTAISIILLIIYFTVTIC